MTETPNQSATTQTSSTSTSQGSGVVTRSQAKQNEGNQNNGQDQNSNYDPDEERHDGNKKRGKEQKEKFKGGIGKMNGHVFQLYEESKKANQFSMTLAQLKKYVAVECEQAKDLATLFEEPIKQPKLVEPSDLPPMEADGKTPVSKESRAYLAWRSSCEKYEDRHQTFISNLNKVFAVILSQCSESLKPKLESTPGYKKAEQNDDCGWLLNKIKDICHHFEHSENRFMALIKAKSAIFNCKQFPTQSTTEYYETFKELISVLESYGGVLNDPPDATPNDGKLTKITDDGKRKDYMKHKYAAILFIMNADKQRYGHLKLELSNSYSRGRDEYPNDLPSAHQLLLTYKGPRNDESSWQPKDKPRGGRGNGGRGGRADRGQGGAGRGESGKGEGGRGNGSTNHRRGTEGNGPGNRSETERSFSQFGLSLSQTETIGHFPDGIPDNYILLDSDSTVSIFRSKEYLSIIRDAEHPLKLQSNGGQQITTKIGTLEGIGDVWYNPDSIANILSLAQVLEIKMFHS